MPIKRFGKLHVVIISRHEKGFPQADLYRDGAKYDTEDLVRAVPHDYMNGGIGQLTGTFLLEVSRQWPDAEIRMRGGQADEYDHEIIDVHDLCR